MRRTRILRRLRRRDPWSGVTGRRSISAVGDHRIHALEFGRGTSTLVLVHGLAGSTRWWRRNVEALCRHYRLLVPDLIGFGRTGLSGRLPSMPGAADALGAWLDAMGVPRAHLLGHSMGGQIAVHLAARHPEKVDRLVLVDSAGIPRPLRPRELARSALGMAPPRSWGDPRFLGTIALDAWTAGPRTLARAAWHIVRDDVRPLLPRIRAPTLIVWGEADRLVPTADAAVFRALIPDSRCVVVPGAAHNPMVDRPAVFNRLVLRFLRGDRVGT